ncbi:MAG: cytochrome d ubiquinol oxidase subunit II [Bacteroidales bacterium]|nr:cytochrome d ubiquinol oxidase subunit II [Bacteroidales bacterium]
MFESFSYLTLQQYWWAIISLLGSLLVFLLFVQGGQTLIHSLGKNEAEKTLLVNVLGHKWETTFTTLVTFGGAFFASFPLFYATSFGGAYWLWIAILFSFIIQAVSYEFRSKPRNIWGKRTYDTFLFINGALGTFLLGTAVATFFSGSEFSVDFTNLSQIGNPVISRWESPYRGLEALAGPHNLTLGFSVFFLARCLGLLYFIKNVDNEDLNARSRKSLRFNSISFLTFFLAFVTVLLTKKGFAVDTVTGEVFLEKFKYFHNLAGMPFIGLLFISGTACVIYGIARTLFTKYNSGIWFVGTGAVMVVFSFFSIAGYHATAYYPSTFDLQSSLTIANSSSSKYTLTVMSYVSLLVPFVLGYIIYAWRAMTRKKINISELESESHVY